MRAHRLGIGAFATLGALGTAFAACSDGSKPGSSPSPTPAPAPDELAARAALVSAPLGHVVSRDARGAARFVAAALESDTAPMRMTAESAARAHLARHA